MKTDGGRGIIEEQLARMVEALVASWEAHVVHAVSVAVDVLTKKTHPTGYSATIELVEAPPKPKSRKPKRAMENLIDRIEAARKSRPPNVPTVAYDTSQCDMSGSECVGPMMTPKECSKGCGKVWTRCRTHGGKRMGVGGHLKHCKGEPASEDPEPADAVPRGSEQGPDALSELISLDRPKTRADCIDGPRPCPWVACRFHLYGDLRRNGKSYKPYYPELEPWEIAETCTLDVADRGDHTLEQIGQLLNVVGERVSQVEEQALDKLKHDGSVNEYK